MKSVFQKEKSCWVCGARNNLHNHHIFEGTSNRSASEKRGFKIWLCAGHHNCSVHGIHSGTKEGKALDISVKRMAQRYYEKNIGSRAEFINEFIRSYLED